MMNTLWKKVFIAVLTVTCTAAYAAPYVIRSDGRKHQGVKIRAKLNGDIILTTDNGDVTYVKGQYKRAVADKPGNWDQTLRDVEGNPSAAIPVLKGFVKSYSNLDWDLRAMAHLAKAQVNSGDAAAGISTYESLFRKSKEAKASDAQWGYYEAMIAEKKYNKLELALKEIIKSGKRTDAARAQVVRGDVLMKQGDTKAAAMDYLKTVLLYKKEKEVQPEALYKAGEALEKLKDPRAEDQFKQVVQSYPSSPWAGKARGKL